MAPTQKRNTPSVLVGFVFPRQSKTTLKFMKFARVVVKVSGSAIPAALEVQNNETSW